MNQYEELFAQICKTTRSLAEQVADYDTTNHDEKGADAAMVMRDDFDHLAEKITNNEQLDKNNYVKLLLGTMIVANNLQDRKDMLEKVLNNYKINIIPKLQRIVNEGNEQNLKELVEELFN